MYHFARYFLYASFLSPFLSLSPFLPRSIKCLNRFPRKKEKKTFHIRQRAEIYGCFFVVDDFPAPSVARNDCDAGSKLNPMMILNNESGGKEETENFY